MLTSTMITNILSNLGNRSSGLIGSQTTTVVALIGINKAIRKLCTTTRTISNEYFIQVTVPDDAAFVAMPSVDVADVAIAVTEIISYVLTLPGETNSLGINYLTAPRFDLFNGVTDSGESGKPTEFCWYANKLYFGPYADQEYTLHLKVKAIPAELTDATPEEGEPAESIPLHTAWLDAIEAYATHYCFLKLQQVQNASSWLATYGGLFQDVVQLFESRPQLDRDPSGSTGGGVADHLNPFKHSNELY